MSSTDKYRFVFQHMRRGVHFKNGQLDGFIEHAASTHQINMHYKRLRPFRGIFESEVITICMAYEENDWKTDGRVPVAQGYSFYRPDPKAAPFSRKDGRWRAENRVRAQLGLDLVSNPSTKRKREAQFYAVKMREQGLKLQQELFSGRRISGGWS